MTLENGNGETIFFLIEALEALAAWTCAVGLGTAVTGAISVNPGNVVPEVFPCLSITLVDTGCNQNSSTGQLLEKYIYVIVMTCNLLFFPTQFLGLVDGYRRGKGRQAQAIASPLWRKDDGSWSCSPAARVFAPQSVFFLTTQFTFSQVWLV